LVVDKDVSAEYIHTNMDLMKNPYLNFVFPWWVISQPALPGRMEGGGKWCWGVVEKAIERKNTAG